MDGDWSIFHSLIKLSLAARRICVVTCLRVVGMVSLFIISNARTGIGAIGHFVMFVRI